MRRKQVFVCSAISKENSIVSDTIEAASSEEAANLFFKLHKSYPKEVLGPLLKKKNFVKDKPKQPLLFTNIKRKAIYDNWLVNAFYLTDPQDCAFLVFIKRIDGKKIPKPIGAVTVPIKELIFQDEPDISKSNEGNTTLTTSRDS